MHKIHNSGINIFGVIPLCQFLKELGQVTHVFRGTPILVILPPPYIFPRKCDVVYSNVITNDVICAPFATLLKRSREAKIDIALVHLCDFQHCVPALMDSRLCMHSYLLLCFSIITVCQYFRIVHLQVTDVRSDSESD